ncbi:MAG: rod shape-determining protein RodA [Kofleriaceae bacterium]|nr:rod shape-determining protein RodA [Myxococcales bacterium]MCB9563483.1 rod shape-determining protein RodA [Kofleriaceae bacterium]MCB9574751.1 rod shape-determining protein RodA [Kofleriaceae bacterium]
MSLWKGFGELPRSQVGVTRWQRFRASVDVPLVMIIAVICGVGLLNLYSATHGTRHHAKFDQQVQWIVIGSIAFVITTLIDYRALVRLAWIAIGGAITLLLVVRLIGEAAHAKGSYRWFNLGALGGQPSEVAKIAVILLLARLFHDAEVHRLRWQDVALRCIALVVPVLLIAMQPDLGTSILLVLLILSVGFLCMPNLWPMVYVTLAGLATVPIVWENMHWYQKQRVLAFLDPGADPTGAGWHTRQSIFAVGSGKITGKGWMHGTQNQFDFLPEHWTDFPFSVWAEEWGFVGSVALLAVFAFLLVWILNVAMSARDRAGTVICVGVGAMTFWHVVVNVAMVLGMAPVVGVTLPFISYGGSSLLTFFVAMGLVASVSLRKHGY